MRISVEMNKINSLESSIFNDSWACHVDQKVFDDAGDRDIVDVQLIAFYKKQEQVERPSNWGKVI
jgi:hypothetical protein